MLNHVRGLPMFETAMADLTALSYHLVPVALAVAWRRTILVAMSVVALLPAGAFAETLTYDPESCSRDAKGMVYLAFDRVVLRVPAEELTLIRDLPPERLAEVPAPPNPNEPEGCPDHPIQAGGFTFSYLYEAIRKNKRDPQLPPYVPRILKLTASKPDFWGLQLFVERDFEKTCDMFQDKGEIDGGLIACWHPLEGDPRPREARAVHLKARPEIYGAPFGRPFVVSCMPRGPAGQQDCQVQYKLYETLNVFYEVRVQNKYSKQVLPLDQIIEFDRVLRTKIEAARVENFNWFEVQK
jgi:hypothetical protein